MAKRGTLNHRRTRRLASALGVPRAHALGLMEALWHITADNAPRGDVGRMSEQDLADEIYWEGDPAALIAGFLAAGVLEQHATYKLVVHGWSEHADNALRHKLKRAGQTFWDGEAPFRTKSKDGEPSSGAAESATDHGQTASDHDDAPAVADSPRPDEIEPASASNQCQQPVPVPASTDNGTPLAPQLPLGGTGGRAVHHVGEVLAGGAVVEEVNDAGQILVARRSPAAAEPAAERELRAAVERLVELGAREYGHRFDRAARRKLRDRLRSGETEERIAGVWAATFRELQEIDELEEPSDEAPEAPPPHAPTFAEEMAALRARHAAAAAERASGQPGPGHDVDQALRLVARS